MLFPGLRNQEEDKINPDEPRPKRRCSLNRDYSFKKFDIYLKQSCLASPDSSFDLDESEIEGLIVNKDDSTVGHKVFTKINFLCSMY